VHITVSTLGSPRAASEPCMGSSGAKSQSLGCSLQCQETDSPETISNCFPVLLGFLSMHSLWCHSSGVSSSGILQSHAVFEGMIKVIPTDSIRQLVVFKTSDIICPVKIQIQSTSTYAVLLLALRFRLESQTMLRSV
jgi:hypothetical protein